MGNPIGRPTKYNAELQEQADSYIYQLDQLGHAVPSRVGLCCFLGIHKATSYEWELIHPDFSDTLKQVETLQEHMSINGGLLNKLNPTIVKLLLANFGYSDKISQDHTTNGKDLPAQGLDVSKLSTEALAEIVAAAHDHNAE